MIPKTKTHEAYEYLKNYHGLTNPNSFKYLSWLNSAEKLIKTDPVDGYVLQGFAHMALGDIQSAVQSMKKAYLLNNIVATYNYATLLYKSGEFSQSHQMCLNVLNKDPYDSNIIEVVLSNASRSLDLNILNEAFELFQGGNLYIDNQKIKAIDFIKNTISKLKITNITQDNFVYIYSLLNRFLSKHYIGDYYVDVDVSQTEIGNILNIDIYLNNVGTDDCLDLDDKFLDVLIDDSQLNFDDYKNIIVHFIPAKYDDLECMQ
ncbi:hypothetical protein LU293_09505 [Moraxella nasovis]|uniref:tetratricopeptide repeat protein n=1 Tax=Moraxella nasovis TaxID=2904121 RepID=UPI001F60A9BF|nr:hypothetical protein [Moraxella nasovis]UNU73285.1 hypothetical protein LU293_09505 [Moraxella nasovis]